MFATQRDSTEEAAPPPPHGGPLHSVEWVALPDLSSSRPNRPSELPLQLCGTCQVPYVPHCSHRTMYWLNADLLRIHYHVPDSRETSVRTRKTPCPWGLLFWWEADAAPGSADRCNCALWSSRALSFPGVWTCVTTWTRTRTSKEPCKTHCHLSCLLPSTYSFQPKAALLHNHSPSPRGSPRGLMRPGLTSCASPGLTFPESRGWKWAHSHDRLPNT